jgi:hypothetical protein
MIRLRRFELIFVSSQIPEKKEQRRNFSLLPCYSPPIIKKMSPKPAQSCQSQILKALLLFQIKSFPTKISSTSVKNWLIGCGDIYEQFVNCHRFIWQQSVQPTVVP